MLLLLVWIVSQKDLLNKQLHEQAIAPHLVNKDVTEEFSNLIMKCIAKNRDDRWRNFHEVLMEMKKIRVFRSIIPKRDKRQGPAAG